LTGARTSGGACGLIRRNAKNLTWARTASQRWWKHCYPAREWSRGAAWLSSARVVRCWVKSRNERNPCPVLQLIGTLRRPPAISWRKVGTTSSHHGLYVQGYTRATMGGTDRCKPARGSKSEKTVLSSDCRLQLACMKLESLVMAYQNDAVNTFPGLVHTARHITKVDCTRSLWANPQGRQRPKV
jgi:hypothetical protein